MQTMAMVEHYTSSPIDSSASFAHITHEIFLSHSGQQTGFVKDLHRRLSVNGFTVFFDKDRHSLPPGRDFPHHILSAANTCKLAIIVLSHDFLTSKWPMIELCIFAERYRLQSSSSSSSSSSSNSHHASRSPTIDILPLFLELSPEDLNKEQNMAEWRRQWQAFEEADRRMDACKCEDAAKLLRRFNGIKRLPRKEQGEESYTDEVVNAIEVILAPRKLYRCAEVDETYVGKDRLLKVILNKFRELEEDPAGSSSESNICILGMHGVPGSGKTSLCRNLCDFVFDMGEFGRNVFILEPSTPFDKNQDSMRAPLIDEFRKLIEKCMHTHDARERLASKALDQLCRFLYAIGAQFSQKMFLVLDNILLSNYDSYVKISRAILRSGILRSGSRIMLVAPSADVLNNLFEDIDIRHYTEASYTYDFIEVPCLMDEEAMEIIRDRYPSANEDLLRESSFRSSFMYIPMVFKLIGIFLRNNNDVAADLDSWKMVNEGREDAVQQLVSKIFAQLKEELKDLFLDIALFVLPAGFWRLDDLTSRILCRMHGIHEERLRNSMAELARHCLLSVVRHAEEPTMTIEMHDIFTEFARYHNDRSSIETQSYIHGKLDVRPLAETSPESRIEAICRERFSNARIISIELPSKYAEMITSIDVHLTVGNKAKALLVKNQSENTSFNLGLWNDLSSLVYLKLENVHGLRVAHSPPNLVWFSWDNKIITGDNAQIAKETSSGSGWLSYSRWHAQQLAKRLMKQPLSIFSWEQQQPALHDQLVTSMVASQLVTVLELKNIPIQSLDIRQCCLPELKVLNVVDDAYQLVSVSIGYAPMLKLLSIGTREVIDAEHNDVESMARRLLHRLNYTRTQKRKRLQAKSSNLVLQLDECSQLRDVHLETSLFDRVELLGSLPATLDRLMIYSPTEGTSTCNAPIGRKLMSSVNQLSHLGTLNLIRSDIERLDFIRPCPGSRSNDRLTIIHLQFCNNLTHLSIGPGCLPKLRNLEIEHCSQLQALEGLENVKCLQWFILRSLPQLKSNVRIRNSDENSVRLKYVIVQRCPGVKIDINFLEVWEILELEDTCVAVLNVSDKLSALMVNRQASIKLQNVSWCYTESGSSDEDLISSSSEITQEESTNVLVLVQENACSDIQSNPTAASSSSSMISSVLLQSALILATEGSFARLRELKLADQGCLTEIEGIEHLQSLEFLTLLKLPNLTRVSGIWPTCIEEITLDDCPMLQEIPPFQNTPELNTLEFSKCLNLEAIECCFDRFELVDGYTVLKFDFRECVSMEVFPMKDVMDDLRKRSVYYPRRLASVSVCGSKFASVEVLQRWLQEAEFGSPLFEAAVEGLLWERMYKNEEMGTWDAVLAYFTAPKREEEDLDEAGLEYLCDFLSFKKKEFRILKEWILAKFPHVSTKIETGKETRKRCLLLPNGDYETLPNPISARLFLKIRVNEEWRRSNDRSSAPVLDVYLGYGDFL